MSSATDTEAHGHPPERKSPGSESGYRSLGSTGIMVSPLCLGAMMLGPYGNPDVDECVRIVHRALDSGINFIDTADAYSFGESEAIIGKAVRGCREDVVIATKFSVPMGDGPNERGHSRRWILAAVEDSLRRLGTDYIDLYQAHRPDPTTDLDELLGTLSTLIHQGKVRAIGSSKFPAHDIVEAHWLSERRGRERLRCEQPPYSLMARDIERDVLPVCRRYGMGVITWGPLAGGWLSGRYHRGMEQPSAPRNVRMFSRYDLSRSGNQRKFDIVEQVEEVARDVDLPIAKLSVAFAMNHPDVTSVLIGPRTIDQLEGLLGVTDVRLSPDVLDRLDAIAPPGETVASADRGYDPPAITEKALRRR